MSGHFEGLRVWLLQRVSAIYLGLFLTYVLAHFFLNPRPDYEAWRAWFAHPLVVICSAGFVIALLLHAWVGLRDVVLDYVRHLGARMVLLILIIFLLTGCGLWAIRILIFAGCGTFPGRCPGCGGLQGISYPVPYRGGSGWCQCGAGQCAPG